MAFDGIVTSGVVYELSGLLKGGRIAKIGQTEKDEILLNIHSGGIQYKLVLSASPANPRIHLTRTQKENPSLAPTFCMILRKHLQGGIITDISQSGFDRIVTITVDTIDEMGDRTFKKLIIEIMGRQSNIILVGHSGVIYDAIRHVDTNTSSYREVLPARPYIAPPAQDKLNPTDNADLAIVVKEKLPLSADGTRVSNALLNNLSGYSPMLSNAICALACVDGAKEACTLTPAELDRLSDALVSVGEKIKNHEFKPFIIKEIDEPTGAVKYCDFHCMDVAVREPASYFSTVNMSLDEYYSKKDTEDRLRQRKASLVKSLSNIIARIERKLAIFASDMEKSSDYEKYKAKGELILANMYMIKPGDSEVTLIDYYQEDCPSVTIKLDSNLSASDNSQKFFRQYRKKKSTFENAIKNTEEAETELQYLRSVEAMLANAASNDDISGIGAELTSSGYIQSNTKEKSKNPNKKKKKPQKEAVLIDSVQKFEVSDGYIVYVGKNNIQNDYLTREFASPNDMWLHVKNAPGSHVILRTSLMGGEYTKGSIEDAANIAAFYSSLRSSPKAEVDFTKVKYVKKPSGALPGKVIFTNQKTIVAVPHQAENFK